MYQVQINGIAIKKTFTHKSGTALNSLWTKFNNYAKKRGYTMPTRCDCLGDLAWANESNALMTIVEV